MIKKQKSLRYLFLPLILILFTSNISIAQNDEIPITTSSKKALTLFVDGRTAIENIDVNKATKLFDSAIKEDPSFALAHLYRSLTGVGGLNKTRIHLMKAKKLMPKVSEGERDLINYQIAASEGNNKNGKVYLNKLLTSFPYDKRVHFLAGLRYYGISDTKSALAELRKTTSLDKYFAPAYNMIGYIESALENNKAAEKAFKTYIKLNPDNPNPYDSYAELLMNQGRYDESIVQYEKALSKDKNFNNARIGLGHNYVFKDDFEEARKNYNMVFTNSNTIGEKLQAQYWIATSYVHQQNITKALDVLEERRTLAKKNKLIPTVISTFNSEGFILTEANMPKAGMKKFKEAGKVIKSSNLPKDVIERMNIQNRLNTCYALTANNQIKEAEKEASICTKMVNDRGNPNEIQNLHGTIALLEMKKGNYKNAVKHFEKTSLINSPYNWYKLGLAYEKMGNKQEATKYFNKAGMSNVNGIGSALIRKRARE